MITMTIMPNNHATETELPPHAPILGEDDVLEGTIVADPHLVLEISLNGEESRLIEAAARAASMPMGRYIKQIVIESAHRAVG